MIQTFSENLKGSNKLFRMAYYNIYSKIYIIYPWESKTPETKISWTKWEKIVKKVHNKCTDGKNLLISVCSEVSIKLNKGILLVFGRACLFSHHFYGATRNQGSVLMMSQCHTVRGSQFKTAGQMWTKTECVFLCLLLSLGRSQSLCVADGCFFFFLFKNVCLALCSFSSNPISFIVSWWYLWPLWTSTTWY